MNKQSRLAMHKLSHRVLGFTLTVLMVTLVILSILVGIATPGMRSLLTKQQLNSNTHLMVSILAYARNEAVSRVVKVVICGTSDASTCNGSSDFSKGWLVFIDNDEDNLFSNGDELLKQGGGQEESMHFALDNSDTFISFTDEGESTSVKKIELCPDDAGSNPNKSRSLTVSMVGSSRISQGANCP